MLENTGQASGKNKAWNEYVRFAAQVTCLEADYSKLQWIK